MPIVVLGKSLCPLCHHILATEDQLVSFTHFLPSTHRWWQLSDSAMHRECLDKWPHRDAFTRLYRKAREIQDSRPSDLATEAEITAWTAEATKRWADELQRAEATE